MSENLTYKVCSKCGEEKPVGEFNIRKDSMDGYRNECKECRKIYNKKYVIENYEKIKEINHLKYLKNRELRLVQAKEYRDTHKEEIYQYTQTERGKEARKRVIDKRKKNGKRTKYQNWKIKNDVNYKLSQLLSTRLQDVIKQQNTKKNNSTLNLLGCSLKELKQYLESQFTEGMTWENHGKWHIDHYIPCSYFNLSNPKAQEICFHFLNLRPMWGIDNIKKKDKPPKDTDEHILKIILYRKQQKKVA